MLLLHATHNCCTAKGTGRAELCLCLCLSLPVFGLTGSRVLSPDESGRQAPTGDSCPNCPPARPPARLPACPPCRVRRDATPTLHINPPLLSAASPAPPPPLSLPALLLLLLLLLFLLFFLLFLLFFLLFLLVISHHHPLLSLFASPPLASLLHSSSPSPYQHPETLRRLIFQVSLALPRSGCLPRLVALSRQPPFTSAEKKRRSDDPRHAHAVVPTPSAPFVAEQPELVPQALVQARHCAPDEQGQERRTLRLFAAATT
ncbi:hypothetical protein CDD83_9296 [Cordyceps sp. RAO-2017]|nr:hypothetical protein CDD83_9296 [Cordyceps sp. RAO-2017]